MEWIENATEDHHEACKKYYEEGRDTVAEDAKKSAEADELYDKTVFEAAHTEIAFVTTMAVFRTTTDILTSNNEVIHHLRKVIGEIHSPIRISTNLAGVS